jgi:aminopeptidase N
LHAPPPPNNHHPQFLNEGFATLVEYIGADHATPQFETGRQFFTGDVLRAMRASCWANSRPLVSPVDSSAAIESQFDGVSYAYGGSLLQAARGFMEKTAPGSFFAGVTAYLTAHQYGNAEPAALWAALGAAAGLPDLPAWLQAYTTQTGYPLVSLSWENPITGEATGTGVLTVSQARHFFSPASAALAPPGQADYTWWVPLTLTCGAAGPNPVTVAADAALASGGFTTRTWATTIGSTTSPYNISAHGWVHVNTNASGFFRVNYPVSVWRALAAGAAAQLSGAPAAAGATPLSPLDRAAMMDDVWTLAEGGVAPGVDTPLALDVSAAVLPLETAYEVWLPSLSHLYGNLRQLLFLDDGTPGPDGAVCLANLEAVARRLLAPLVAALGWGTPGEPPITTALRGSVLSAASNFNLTNVTSPLATLFGAWAAQYASGTDAPTSVPADLQPAVFASAVRWGVVAPARGGGSAPAFSILLGAAAATDDAATKRRYLAALAASRDPAALATLLATSLNTSIVRPQDTTSTLADVAANPVGRPLAWAFAKANWAVLMERYGAGGFALSSLVASTSGYFNMQASYDDVAAWYGSHPLQGAVNEWHQALEAISARTAWRAASLVPTCAKLAGMAAAAAAA